MEDRTSRIVLPRSRTAFNHIFTLSMQLMIPHFETLAIALWVPYFPRFWRPSYPKYPADPHAASRNSLAGLYRINTLLLIKSSESSKISGPAQFLPRRMDRDLYAMSRLGSQGRPHIDSQVLVERRWRASRGWISQNKFMFDVGLEGSHGVLRVGQRWKGKRAMN